VTVGASSGRRSRESRHALTLVVLLAAALAAIPSAAEAATILRVDADVDVAGADGSSWDKAYKDLQDALDEASGGGSYEIWVAEGTYTPSVPAGRDATFQLLDGVALYGGFSGTEDQRGARDWESNKTILSGDLDGDDAPDFTNRADNCYHVTTGSGTDATAVLDGFTVRGGNVTNSSPRLYGGGMLNDGGGPTVIRCIFADNASEYGGAGMANLSGSNATITDCTFSDNAAGQSGGGMYNSNSSPTVTACSFLANSSDIGGGGMLNVSSSSPTVTNCTFSHNTATDSGGGLFNRGACDPMVMGCTFSGNTAENCGGAMFSDDGSNPTVTDCLFSGNSAGDDGGAMVSWNADATVTNCTFSDNSAEREGGAMWNQNSSLNVTGCTFTGNSAWCGGGMHNTFHSSVTVTSCTFSGNRAEATGPTTTTSCAGGGICNSWHSRLTVTNCTFSGNSAEYYGGGLYSLLSSATVTNCTFSSNSAEDGGGMYNQRSNPVVTNCTFYDNSGAGMHNNDSNPTVKNTIFAGNSPRDCNGGVSSLTSGGYNLESGTSCGCTQSTDLQYTDPLLGPLADNGGPTLTHALLPGSPALDAIPAPYNGALTTDQRGFPRPYVPGGFADIGAVEMQYAYSLGDVDGSGAIDLLDVVLCQQIAGGLVRGTPGQRAAADIDRDGDVDWDDVSLLAEHLLVYGGAP